MEQFQKEPSLKPLDLSLNAFQAILKSIPYFGSSLEQFIFGPLNELRMRRIEATLREVAEILRQKEISNYYVDSEEFVNLLESVAPSLSRSTNENRRQRFRDLLLNAAQISPEDPQWDEATLASKILENIDDPGLVILAAMGRIKTRNKVYRLETGRGTCQVVGDRKKEELPYDWPIVQECALRLRDMRLIETPPGSRFKGSERIELTPLGELLIRWTLGDEAK